MKLKVILGLGFAVLLTSSTSQAALAIWTFETSLPTTGGPHAAEGGINAAVSVASGFHAGATVYSNPVGAGSAESFSSTAWAVGDYYQFTTSTLGHNNLSVSFKATSSNTGPKDFRLAYSTDGVNFTDAFSYSVYANAAPNIVWATGMTSEQAGFYNISGTLPSALDNQSTIYLRLIDNSTTSANDGTVATAGTSRVDDFMIEATPIPEPSTWVAGALLALPFGLHGIRYLRNRKRA